MMFEYYEQFTSYSKQGEKITSDCNCIIFINESPHEVVLNSNLILAPKIVSIPSLISFFPMLELRGNIFEIDRTQYEVKFSDLDIQGGTAKLVVIRKFYKRPDLIEKFIESLGKNGK